jgi:hypothetical protein
VRQDVDQAAEGIAQVGAPDAPRLVGDLVDDLTFRVECALLDPVDILISMEKSGTGAREPPSLAMPS